FLRRIRSTETRGLGHRNSMALFFSCDSTRYEATPDETAFFEFGMMDLDRHVAGPSRTSD
ncbi:MAG: hypothetical protein VX034_00245, partial [Planctomycetota bacterium]|nr:hypothetical protein [Planctomycetota bacterium]